MAYNNDVPKATQSVSATQSPIHDNFAALHTVNAVNHVAFDAAGQGKHKFMQMPEQSAAPTTAANEAALYTKESAYTAATELFYRREGSGDEIELTSMKKSSTGWARLPCGLLLKWTNGISASTGLTTVTWPTGPTIPAFTEVYATSLVPTGSSSTDDKALMLKDITTLATTFYGVYRTTTNSRAVGYQLIVLGA